MIIYCLAKRTWSIPLLQAVLPVALLTESHNSRGALRSAAMSASIVIQGKGNAAYLILNTRVLAQLIHWGMKALASPMETARLVTPHMIVETAVNCPRFSR